jgi:hypothetical protein
MEDKSLVIFTSILKEDAGLYICEADSPFSPTYSARIIVKDRGMSYNELLEPLTKLTNNKINDDLNYNFIRKSLTLSQFEWIIKHTNFFLHVYSYSSRYIVNIEHKIDTNI